MNDNRVTNGRNSLLIILRRGSVQVLQFSYSHTLYNSKITFQLLDCWSQKPYSVLYGIISHLGS